MAKRYSSKKGRNIEPSVQTVLVSTPGVVAGAVGSFTADLSQIASLINRRFYRQGINWAVAGFKILTAGTGTIQVRKLPNTWVMSNSWTKSFKAWQKMNNEALAENESARGKFLDFKIYADEIHHAAGTAANLLPVNNAVAVVPTATPGEWDMSKVVVPFGPASPGNTAEHEFIATGSSFPGAGASGLNAVSLIEGYAASRGLPMQVDPNTPADMDDADGSTPENWLTAMFNDGTDQDSEVLANLTTEGDRPPYPYEGDSVSVDTMYPGGANQMAGLELHDVNFLTGTTVGGMTYIKGGNFPCGLVRFDWAPAADSSGSNVVIQIDLVPGNHRGYLCEPMLEM